MHLTIAASITNKEGGPMPAHSVIHDTFTIERTYPAPPAGVFAAFASEEAKNIWGDAGGIEPVEPGAQSAPSEFDFRLGGRERHGHVYQGATYLYDALYYDIVPDQRIVFGYEMYADGVRFSVSVTTIEFAKTDEGTALTYTEQGAYLDGIDGPEAPALRKWGTNEMLNGLTGYLQAQTAS
jgi:uncharacterized protein YndB with AHSA1/START domain